MNWTKVLENNYKKTEVRDHTVTFKEMVHGVLPSLFKTQINIYISMDFPEGVITLDQINDYITCVAKSQEVEYEIFPASPIEDCASTGFLYRSWTAEAEMKRYNMLKKNREIEGYESKTIINTEYIYFYPSRALVDAVYEKKIELPSLLESDELRQYGYKIHGL